MRKIIAGIMAFCMAGSIFPVYNSNISGYSLTANAEETITEGELTFTVYDNYAEVTGCSKSAKGKIIIPESVNGLPVKEILFMAFVGDQSDSDVINDRITSVVIPDSVVKIGDMAFYNCTALTEITIPESVQYIIGHAFEGTPWLENKRKENPLVIVNDILIDGRKCEGDIIIPDNVKSIAELAFFQNENIISVEIPDSVECIKDSAFFDCSSLSSVTIGKGVKRIEKFSFKNTKIASIVIPENVEVIGDAAFLYTPSPFEITVLNPECEFPIGGIKWDTDFAVPLTTGKYEFQGTIYGYDGSTAEEYVKSLPEAMWNFVSLGTAPEKSDIIYGDANLDGKVSISDSVMILQYVSNAVKYPLSNQAMLNADVYGNDGVTARDAFSIEKYDAGILTSLPEKEQL